MTKPRHCLTIAKVRAAITACGNRATAMELAELLHERPSTVSAWLRHQIAPETRIAIADWKLKHYPSGKSFRVPVYSVVPAGDDYVTTAAPVRVLEPMRDDSGERMPSDPSEEEIYRMAAELRVKRPRDPVGMDSGEVLPQVFRLTFGRNGLGAWVQAGRVQ